MLLYFLIYQRAKTHQLSVVLLRFINWANSRWFACVSGGSWLSYQRTGRSQRRPPVPSGWHLATTGVCAKPSQQYPSIRLSPPCWLWVQIPQNSCFDVSHPRYRLAELCRIEVTAPGKIKREHVYESYFHPELHPFTRTPTLQLPLRLTYRSFWLNTKCGTRNYPFLAY